MEHKGNKCTVWIKKGFIKLTIPNMDADDMNALHKLLKPYGIKVDYAENKIKD